jgi:RNA recognition motif-containing protein
MIKNSFLHFEESRKQYRRSSTAPALPDSFEADDEMKVSSPSGRTVSTSDSPRLSGYGQSLETSIASFFEAVWTDAPMDLGAQCQSQNSDVSPAKRNPRFREVSKAKELTTVMIRNIPCKYKQEYLMEEVSAVTSNFDFLYMPPARRDGGSKGYAFVNFCDEESAAKFLREFDGHVFYRQPNSLKRAEVGYAEAQGLAKNVKFYKRCKAVKTKFHPYINRAALKMAAKN